MDEPELTRLRATYSHWHIDVERQVFVKYIAVRGTKTVRTDSLTRLEQAMTDLDAGVSGH